MAKDWSTLHTLPQSEALLNEVKGNLFEYLVALELSKKCGLSAAFIQSFSQIGGGRAQEDLRHYQNWLRENDPELFSRLPGLASKAALHLYEIPEIKTKKFYNLLVTGKSGAVSGQSTFKECDILLEGKDFSVPISLKFCKRGAYVNTKSGGIRSFIEKYFSSFSTASGVQRELNVFLEKSFIQMAQELYSWADLDGDHLMERTGHFSEQWAQAQLPELPGQLDKVPRQSLFNHYYRVIDKLYHAMRAFEQKDREKFLTCLAPLMGLSDSRLVQLTLFHKNRHEFDSLEVYSGAELQNERDSLCFRPLRKEVSSFSLAFEGRSPKKTLQIRVKPMNKFTVSALKVNCSVKTESVD